MGLYSWKGISRRLEVGWATQYKRVCREQSAKPEAHYFRFARHPPGIRQLFGTNSQNRSSQSRVDVR